MNDNKALTEREYVRRFAAAAHPIFVQNDWTYFDDRTQAPSVERLEDMAAGLVASCRRSKDIWTASCGRMIASRHPFSDVDAPVELSLELVSYWD